MTELALSKIRNLGFDPDWFKTAWFAIFLVVLAIALFDPAMTGHHIVFALKALASTAPYVVVAVLLIAGLKATGAEHTLAEAFKGREVQMIVMASLFGGLAPFCSCEVIPFVAGLLAAGVPLSAIMAFWLSSPLIDPPTLLITANVLGWEFAIGKAVGAVSIGLFGGTLMLVATRLGLFANPAREGAAGSSCGCGPKLGSQKPQWVFWHEAERVSVFKNELINNALFLFKWLLLAYLLESLLITYVPAEWIGRFVGGEGVMPVVISALVGAPAYLNAYVAPPLVAGLMEQGMSAGAAMAFMMAGSVSCIPAMVAVFSLVRVQVFAAYFGLGLVGAILSGLVFMTVA